jgi:hypothetical protein
MPELSPIGLLQLQELRSMDMIANLYLMQMLEEQSTIKQE